MNGGKGAKAAAKSLPSGAYVRKADGTVTQTTAEAGRFGEAPTYSGRKVKHAEVTVLAEGDGKVLFTARLAEMEQAATDASLDDDPEVRAARQRVAAAKRKKELLAQLAAEAAREEADADAAAAAAQRGEAAREEADADAAAAAAQRGAAPAPALAAAPAPAPPPAPPAAAAGVVHTHFDMAGHSHAPIVPMGRPPISSMDGLARTQRCAGRPVESGSHGVPTSAATFLEANARHSSQLSDTMQLFLMQRETAQRAADRHDADMMMLRLMRDSEKR
jgi:hypothetical protein